MTRVTVVRSDQPLPGPEEGHDWMRSLDRDRDLREEVLAEATAAMNRAIHAFAVACGNPYTVERSPAQAAAIRAGHGLGRELANGRYTESIPLDPGSKAKRRRREAPPGQARVAAILGGRERADACETFVLRARADLDAGRLREATIGLDAAILAMLVELAGALSDPEHEADLGLLAARRDEVRSLARRATEGPLDESGAEVAEELISVCERILRRRRILRG